MVINKWYYENSCGISLTKLGEDFIKSQLNDSDICKRCESKLTVITMMEGSFIVCSKNMYHRIANYKIDYSDLYIPPKLIRSFNG